jgi:uncharacterized membrane-anchored protein YhcB (DUF1043 family)
MASREIPAGTDLRDEITSIKERLREIRTELESNIERSPSADDTLIEEERQLQVRLQELADRVTDDNSGLAESLVRSEGANADEFPELPPDGDDPKA